MGREGRVIRGQEEEFDSCKEEVKVIKEVEFVCSEEEEKEVGKETTENE